MSRAERIVAAMDSIFASGRQPTAGRVNDEMGESRGRKGGNLSGRDLKVFNAHMEACGYIRTPFGTNNRWVRKDVIASGELRR
jgi:hypothetical protein